MIGVFNINFWGFPVFSETGTKLLRFIAKFEAFSASKGAATSIITKFAVSKELNNYSKLAKLRDLIGNDEIFGNTFLDPILPQTG